jgi:hypothetical protein
VRSHLSEEEIQKYHTRALSPSELLELDEHMESCADCSSRLLPEDVFDARVTSLQNDLQSAEDEDHLEYEQIIGYLKNTLSKTDQEVAEKHLQSCSTCTAEAQDLAHFRRVMQKREKSRTFIRVAGIAAALVGIAIAARLFFQSSEPVAFVINDGQNQIAFNKEAHIIDKNLNIGTIEQQQLQSAFQGKGLAKPSALQDLQGKNGVLLSDEPTNKNFELLGPVATVVSTDRPTFRWKAAEGISDFSISIYDTNFNPVANSPITNQKQWTIETPLERGKVYLWIVSGHLGEKIIKAPVPPAPEAKFEVLSAGDFQKLNQHKLEYGQSHLLLGLYALQLGLIDDAGQEWSQLSKENPNSKEVKMLLESLEKIRHPK